MTIQSDATTTETVLRDRVATLTLEQKVCLLTGADIWALHAEPEVGLRRMQTSDGPVGVRGRVWDERRPSVNIPSPTGLAASWDPGLVERLGRLLAAEARRKDVDILLAPTINLHRTPYGGRHFECFSEDPLLTSAVGGGFVRGVQAGGVAATVKHFVGNDSETERWTFSVEVDEQALREIYLAPFEALVREAGAWAVMASYNSVGGVSMTEHPMLRELLKGEWGFDGVVMSDWHATRSLEATASAGLDLAMPGPYSPWVDGLVTAVREGRVDEAAIDDKVVRLLRLAGRVGALTDVEPEPVSPWNADDAAVAVQVREAAAAGMVLLRNENGLLPLDAGQLRRVALIGPNAKYARAMGGGSASVAVAYSVSPLDGIRAALGPQATVEYLRGARAGTRLAPIPLDAVHAPDGGEGVDLLFFGRDGELLLQERRRTTSFMWLGEPPGVDLEQLASLEVHGCYRAETGGTHLLGCSGLGRAELIVDGQQLFDVSLELPPGADPVEGLMRPPQHAAPVDLEAGTVVPFVLRYSAADGGTPGLLAFQLNADEPSPGPEAELAQAVALARDSDVAVVVVGTSEEVESEGFDRADLRLPGGQDELVRAVAAANPRTVVVVNAGAPVLLPWIDDVPATLVTWFPGQEFGNALADVLLGAAEPGGRLPVVWPSSEGDHLPGVVPVDGALKYAESLHVGQAGWDRSGLEPAFPFGHGLGYTTWEYEAVDTSGAAGPDRPVTLRILVRNSGSRAGREVVQVYASRPESAVPRRSRWLVGFAAVDAGAGEAVTATITLDPRRFAHWDAVTHAWAWEPGTFRLAIGPSSTDARLTTTA